MLTLLNQKTRQLVTIAFIALLIPIRHANGIVQAQVTTGTVTGRVLDADSLTPLQGIRVGSKTVGWVITDAGGHYVLKGIPSGRQQITAEEESPTYLYQLLTTPIILTSTAGLELTGIDFHVRFVGSVAGTVLDEDGNPVSRARVILIGREYSNYFFDADQYSNGDLWYSQKAFAITDDRGKYVLTSVPAGRPHWILAYKPTTNASAVSNVPEDVSSRKRTLALTYYPNATQFADAAPLIVGSGERRENIDIRMAHVSSYCLSATLTVGRVPTQMRFTLAHEEIDRLERSTSTIPSVSGESGNDGSIRLCDLQTGRYNLTAYLLTSTPAQLHAYGSTFITIPDRDVKEVEVTATAPITLAGEVDSNMSPIRSLTSGIRIGLTGERLILANISETGEFVLGPTPRDYTSFSTRYSLVITGLTPTQYVNEIAQGGTSVLYRSVIPGNGRLHITINDGAGRIAVRVVDPTEVSISRSTVIILPSASQTEAELATTMLAGTTDDNGQFVTSGLPPGKYYVLATNDPPPSVLRGGLYIEKIPETMSMLLKARSRGKEVEVGQGLQIDVTIAPIALK